MRLFLGVDGGQSGTTALIGDESGRILGEGEAGPCNHAAESEGRRKLEFAVRESITAACVRAGLDPATVSFAAACFGMSGGPEDKRQILAAILHAERLLVTTDADIALSGAVEAGQGIVVIAGTGSIALGRNAEGRKARAGGWGYLFGDEGGAFDIARQALRAALRMEEGWGPPTELRRLLLESTTASSTNDLMHRFYTSEWPRSRIAVLAQLVDASALAGDAVATDILHRAAQHLALLAASVRGQLWRSSESVEVCYIGGVFQSQLLRERFRILVELESGNRCNPPHRGPAQGALLEAYRAAGLIVDLTV
ncbi:MAG TPA: BadF/BadG/BcrA/BcrD ATPase family protein [Bryobacteraceae bacterium]|nr:BadF/BadG/BcrA/BcrD ATPase family protein [Bryobacteraceae bacterium]